VPNTQDRGDHPKKSQQSSEDDVREAVDIKTHLGINSPQLLPFMLLGAYENI
jgi:hypothetical protein